MAFHSISYLATGFLAFMGSSIAQPVEPPVITAAPALDIYPRQDGRAPNFVGFYEAGSSYDSVTCAIGGVFTVSSNWGGCIGATQSDVATACRDTSVVVFPNRVLTCDLGIRSCGSAWLYEYPGATSSSTMIGCASSSSPSAWSIYRSTEVISSSTESTSTTSSLSSDTSTTIQATAASPSATETTGSDSDENNSSGSGRDSAWIAGPVVGSVGGTIVIALLVWIVMLLRKRNSQQKQEDNTASEEPQSTEKALSEVPAVSPLTSPNTVTTAELPAHQTSQPPTELHADTAQFSELPGEGVARRI